MQRTRPAVVDLLREDILNGTHPAGRPLTQEDLSRRYGVSRIPVREALQRLEGEGLVRLEGRRGTVVAELDASEAEDIYLMRERLEPLALRLAFPHLTKAHLGRAEDLVDAMEDEPDAARHGALNWAFHRALYEPSDRTRLLKTLDALHVHADRYMRFQFNVMDNRRRSQEEHLAILRALRGKDLPEAERLLSRHVSVAGEQLVDFLGSHLNAQP